MLCQILGYAGRRIKGPEVPDPAGSPTVAAVRGVVVLAPGDVMGASVAVAGISIGVALTLPLLSSWKSAPAQNGRSISDGAQCSA